MFLYHSTNYSLVLIIIVLPYIPDGPKVVITAGTVAASTAAFSGILLTQYFSNCRNRGSNYVTRCSSNTFTV